MDIQSIPMIEARNTLTRLPEAFEGASEARRRRDASGKAGARHFAVGIVRNPDGDPVDHGRPDPHGGVSTRGQRGAGGRGNRLGERSGISRPVKYRILLTPTAVRMLHAITDRRERAAGRAGRPRSK